MVEKDFRNIINSLELTPSLRREKLVCFEKIKNGLLDHSDSRIIFKDILLVGSWAKQSALMNDDLEIELVLDLKEQVPNIYINKVITNEIENILIYHFQDNIQTMEISNDIICLNISSQERYIFYLNKEAFKTKHIQFVEYATQDYTLFKNTILIVKSTFEELQIRSIDEDILECILYHGLVNNLTENKYYDYLNSFLKGLDTFLDGLLIEADDRMYQKFSVMPTQGFSEKYKIRMPFLPNQNLAADFNELNIGEYRKVRKKISKMLENPKTDPYQYDKSFDIVLDVTPLNDGKSIKWSYNAVGKNLANSGGSYENEEILYQTAILKGIFKGLKALEKNNLLRKKIILEAPYPDILGSSMNTSDENKSRIKTIKSYIEQNQLNISTRFKN